MKLILPFAGELTPASSHLLHIAESQGIDCLPVMGPSAGPGAILAGCGVPPEESACLAVCPAVIRAWSDCGEFSPGLVCRLAARFPFILVHDLDTDVFSCKIVNAFSGGRFDSVRTIAKVGASYEVASEEMCGAFSGLKFGPANVEDRVLVAGRAETPAKSIISSGGQTLLAILSLNTAKVFLLGGAPTADIESNVAGLKLSEYFSGLLPVLMVLRHLFGQACWLPARAPHATLIVDDPPLWERYGFLKYEHLLHLMDQFHFHTTVAFIPYYWRSGCSHTVRLFRERPDRFSLCFHGNDHTGGEFRATDSGTLTYLVRMAESRMQAHLDLTGIPCDRVMVFPQGDFSRTAMQVLGERDFVAAVNTGYAPAGEDSPLPVKEVIQPAVLSFRGIPLFLRKYSGTLLREDVAASVFFGRPILIVEHHDAFRQPSGVLDAVSMINRMVPTVEWRSLRTSLENACLMRRTDNGTVWLRPYARTGRIQNPGAEPLRCVAEWPCAQGFVGSPFLDGAPAADAVVDTAAIRVPFEIAPGVSCVVALHRLSGEWDTEPLAPQPISQRTKVHLRRWFSEVRDNQLSNRPWVLSLVKSAHELLAGRRLF
jgi:hypothetical protein